MSFKELLIEKSLENSDIRILDFNLVSNKATAKVLKFGEKASEVIVNFEHLSSEKFHELIGVISDNCYHIASLLSDVRTQELRDLLIGSLEKPYFTATIDFKAADANNDKVAAVAGRIAEMFEDSFWNFFLAFGIGKEEVVNEIFRARKKYKTNSSEQEKSEDPSLSPEQIEKFWDLDLEILKQKYEIRADELPASSLRRLDPLPLSGLEEDADPFFVETYERVSRLAQSYGLSLVNE